jgi:SAM-dependent methyltransferase
MHTSVLNFLNRVASEPRIRGKRVLEVGAFNVNGSPRLVIEPLGPATYVGVDIAPQEGFVDVVLDACDLAEHFGLAAFDVVICTEVLEHVADWEKVTKGLDEVLAPGGLLVVTTRSPGFPLHSYPSDHWRYVPEDLGAMYPNYRMLYLGDDPDPNSPGVFLAGIKLPEPAPVNATPSPMEIPDHCGNEHDQHYRTNNQWSISTQIKEPQAFYHVAGMGHWKEIVTEQLSLLSQAGFPGVVNVGFLGAEHEDGFIAHVAKAAGLRVNIRRFGPDFGQFEFPTQRWMHEVCSQLDPGTPVLYFHGKGVSNTAWQWTMWRWLMNAYCLTKWREMVRSLDVHNCAGVSWMPFCYPASAFPGTFWWTTAGFVAHLTPLDDYLEQFMACISQHNPLGFGYRHAAETWINSRVDVNPCIFGPPESRLWDHSWWTAPENRVWHDSAILLGSPVGRFTRTREPDSFLEASQSPGFCASEGV